MTWKVHRMWRVLETSGGHRRGTFTYCHDKLLDSEEVHGTKGVVDFDDGTRVDGEGRWGLVIVEPFEDEVEHKTIPGHITMGPYGFEVMRELPVTAPTIIQHVISAAVVPRIGNPAKRSKK